MKLPKAEIKTSFWNKELFEFQDAMIGVMYIILLMIIVSMIGSIIANIMSLTIIDAATATILIIIIVSYYKHKKERATK